MQVQKVNSNITPNFQANHLRTARGIINKVNKVEAKVDVFSLNNTDKSFINKTLEEINGEQFPEDKMIVGADEVKDVVKNALRKALTLNKNSKDTILMSIETRGDKKSITGILDCNQNGDYDIDGFTVWKDNERQMSRKNLLGQILRTKGKENKSYKNPLYQMNIDVTVPESSKTSRWLRRNGFDFNRNFDGRIYDKDKLYVDAEKMLDKAAIIDANPQITVEHYARPKAVDLEKFLNID